MKANDRCTVCGRHAMYSVTIKGGTRSLTVARAGAGRYCKEHGWQRVDALNGRTR